MPHSKHSKNNNHQSNSETSEGLERHVDEIMDSGTQPEVGSDEPLSAPKVPGAPKVTDAATAPAAYIDALAPDALDAQKVSSGEDLEVDKVVDQIVAHESDELLAAEDEKLAAAFAPSQKQGFKARIGQMFSRWWHNPRARRTTFMAILAVLVLLAVIPPSRYLFLNTVGVRAGARLIVLDDSTQQPLKNVRVELGGQSGLTDDEGGIKLSRIKLGSSRLLVEKRAFASVDRKITIGWGSNPLGEMKLQPVGVQYTFILSDFLSDQPVNDAEATSGEFSAVADENGKIVLTVDKDNPEEAEVVISAKQYREESVVLPEDNQADQIIKMAPARPHFFVSKRSGRYDVYKIDADGKNEAVVLKGTGSENENISLLPHPEQPILAVVSTRENARNQDGFLLSTLTLIDASDGSKPVQVARSERIELVGWSGDRLAYVQVAAGASAANPRRQLLLSYEYPDGDRKELASSNYFNAVLFANEQIYYAPSRAYQPVGTDKLLRINADGTGRQTILDREVWDIFRTEYDHLNIAVAQDWYTYNFGQNEAQKSKGPPANLQSRSYTTSPDKQRSLWSEERDGKGALLVYDHEDKKDIVLKSQSGLSSPFNWLNEFTVVYRINTDQEIADYAFSLNGGDPVKIRDVTNTGSPGQRYH